MRLYRNLEILPTSNNNNRVGASYYTNYNSPRNRVKTKLKIIKYLLQTLTLIHKKIILSMLTLTSFYFLTLRSHERFQYIFLSNIIFNVLLKYFLQQYCIQQ